MARTAKLKQLTDKAVKAYVSSKAATPLHDGGGLYLRNRGSGSFWYLRLTDPATNAQQWHRMFPDDPAGGYPSKGLADARDEAERLWALRSQGHDPRALRQQKIADEAARVAEAAEQARRRVTVRDLFEHWARVELAPHVRTDGKRSGRKDGGQYIRQQFERRIFNTLGDVAAADVRKADLMAVLDDATAAGKLRTANVLLAALKQMFRFALAREIVERNPLDTVTKRDAGGQETERERTLSPEEVQALASALPAARMNPRSEAAIWLILSTGVRVSEAMNAEWANVDLDAASWHLPETKNGRPHTIHLSAFALAQFQALSALREAAFAAAEEKTRQLTEAGAGSASPVVLSPWVFPNADGSGPVDIKSFGKQLSDRQRSPDRRLQRRSKNTEALSLPGGKWTAHDLRRTAATFMADLGISGDVIDECLNHVIESRVRRTYIRNRRPVEQARAFEALGDRLQALVSGEAQASNVVTLGAARAA